MIRYLTTTVALIASLYTLPALAQERDADGFLTRTMLYRDRDKIRQADNGSLDDFKAFYDTNGNGEITINEYLDKLFEATDPRYPGGLYPRGVAEVEAAKRNLTREEYDQTMKIAELEEQYNYFMGRQVDFLARKRLREERKTSFHEGDRNNDCVVNEADRPPRRLNKNGK